MVLPEEIAERSEPEVRGAMEVLASRISARLGAQVMSLAAGDLVTASIGQLFPRIQGHEIWREHSQRVGENIDTLAPDVQIRLRLRSP